MQPVDKLILHGLVVTMDGDERVLSDGGVAISGSEIMAVGASPELERRYHDAAYEVIDASGRLVLPGLINAHTHAADALFRGLVDDLALEPWLERLWVSERHFLRPETVALGARLAFAEMIRGGTTTALDMFWFPEASAEVAREVGFRLLAGPIYFDGDAPDGLAGDERTSRGREFIESYRRDPLITPCVMPHSTYTVGPESLAAARDLAAEFGVLLHTHASETATEIDIVAKGHGATPPAHLDRLGMLDERTVLAHCVHIDAAEIDLLTRRRTVGVHCPLSNLKLGSGVAPYPAMRRAGMRTALGTDGPVSGNDLDLWLTMRLAATLHKGIHQNPALITAREVVRQVTCEAAAALGLADRVGSLEVGKRGDLILIDLDRPHLVPLYDVYSHLVYAVGRDDISTVLIDGRVVMRDRQLVTLDESLAMAAARRLSEEIATHQRAHFPAPETHR